MKKWFRNITTIEELRSEYKELLKKYHPDNCGDLHIMQEINAEYEIVFATLRSQHMASDESAGQESEEDTALRSILNEIICFNMEIEVIGSWVWCFNCYAYKDSLKALGFKYAPKKRAWIWHYGEYSRYHKGEIPIDDIRAKYGSQKVYHPSNTQYRLN